jgi:hypothetical protein
VFFESSELHRGRPHDAATKVERAHDGRGLLVDLCKHTSEQSKTRQTRQTFEGPVRKGLGRDGHLFGVGVGLVTLDRHRAAHADLHHLAI